MKARRPSRHRPRKQPSQARSVATYRAIVDATARVLVSRGWAALTTNHVAARAGVSVGTLYEWFPAKEALAAALVERHLEEASALLGERAAALAAAPPRTALELGHALATSMIELHEDDPRLHRVLMEEVPHPPATLARIASLETAMSDALAAHLVQAHGIAPVEAPLKARMIVTLLEAATHRWATDPSGTPVARAALIEELARMIAGYVGAR
jgi:AcrR family transcriptional regulator